MAILKARRDGYILAKVSFDFGDSRQLLLAMVDQSVVGARNWSACGWLHLLILEVLSDKISNLVVERT